jgi:hypothetical protein
MCMKRYRSFILLTVGLVCLATGISLFRPQTRVSSIARQNAAKIRDNMSLVELEVILDGPARDESTGPIEPDDDPAVEYLRNWFVELPFTDGRPRVNHVWLSDDVLVIASVGAEGTHTDISVTPVRRAPEGFFAMIRRWLRL